MRFGYTAVVAAQSSLRERKKQRTRETLIDTALELFLQHGFAGVTLDQLCDEVAVSKRTFFRYFTSKEDVAMAPLQDMWQAFLDDLDTREPDGAPLLHFLRDALLGALERMPGEEWPRRTLLSCQLTAVTPSMNAHGLQFCEQTTRAALEVVQCRFGLDDTGDPRPRLTGDMLLAAFRHALADWAAQSDPAVPALASRIRDTVAALPDALAIRCP